MLRVFQNTVLRNTFGSKKNELTGTGEECTLRNFMSCSPHQILFSISYMWGRRETQRWKWWVDTNERDHLEALSYIGFSIKMHLNKYYKRVWNGLDWL
jgi:hypothetical protein